MFAVKMTVDQWKLVCSVLQEAPYRVSAPLISEIDRQVNEAVRPQHPGYQSAMDDVAGSHQPVDRPDSTIY